jgi:hypothetical protein
MTTTNKLNCRQWLRANDYEDIDVLIGQAAAKVSERGSKQRRSWWETLAGGPNGRPLMREGIEFPVLRAAQLREKLPVTPNAICRNPQEKFPPKSPSGRWPAKKKKSR